MELMLARHCLVICFSNGAERIANGRRDEPRTTIHSMGLSHLLNNLLNERARSIDSTKNRLIEGAFGVLSRLCYFFPGSLGSK